MTSSREPPPSDLDGALRASRGASDAWEALPSSHRREYLDWIDEAKRRETRERRIAKTIEMLVQAKR